MAEGVNRRTLAISRARLVRITPLILAVALFMEQMDSTVIATSLPAIAADIGAEPISLTSTSPGSRSRGVALLSALPFLRLPPDAGSNVSGHKAKPLARPADLIG